MGQKKVMLVPLLYWYGAVFVPKKSQGLDSGFIDLTVTNLGLIQFLTSLSCLVEERETKLGSRKKPSPRLPVEGEHVAKSGTFISKRTKLIFHQAIEVR